MQYKEKKCTLDTIYIYFLKCRRIYNIQMYIEYTISYTNILYTAHHCPYCTQLSDNITKYIEITVLKFKTYAIITQRDRHVQ